MNKNIIIGSDHAGFELKSKIINYLNSQGCEVIDVGTHTQESCDYPLIAKDVCKKVLENGTNGILICGTGVGMSIAANKIKGIRAAVVSEACSARLSKEHNNTNVLCFGARIIGEETAKETVDAWLNAEFAGSRHQYRVNMLEA